MSPEHRYVVAFVAASLHSRRLFTHVYDHDAGRRVALGGVVKSTRIDVVDIQGARFSGKPEQLLDHRAGVYVRLAMTGGGFEGFDHASGGHFTGVFSGAPPDGAIQLFDYKTGRYHHFHVS